MKGSQVNDYMAITMMAGKLIGKKTYLHFTSSGIKMGLGKESFYRACQSIPKPQAIYQNTNLIAVLQ